MGKTVECKYLFTFSLLLGLNHTLDQYTADRTEINQTPGNILDILKDTIMSLEETIKGELQKKKGLKVRLINYYFFSIIIILEYYRYLCI